MYVVVYYLLKICHKVEKKKSITDCDRSSFGKSICAMIDEFGNLGFIKRLEELKSNLIMFVHNNMHVRVCMYQECRLIINMRFIRLHIFNRKLLSLARSP